MTDKLIECPHCGRGSCYEQQISEELTTYFCMSCGFQTNSEMKEGSLMVKNVLEHAPELYKDLMYKDEKGLIWFPATVTVPEKGMVFLDGTSKDNWKWSAVKAVEITKEERKKKKYSKDQKYRMQTEAITQFNQNEFIIALDFIGLFS